MAAGNHAMMPAKVASSRTPQNKGCASVQRLVTAIFGMHVDEECEGYRSSD